MDEGEVQELDLQDSLVPGDHVTFTLGADRQWLEISAFESGDVRTVDLNSDALDELVAFLTAAQKVGR